MESEGRALVVAAQLEAPEPGDRCRVALHVHLLDVPAELAHALECGLHVVDREDTYGVAPASPPCIPPAPFGVPIMKPSPDGPGSNRHPNIPP